jgi:hypothetical protein
MGGINNPSIYFDGYASSGDVTYFHGCKKSLDESLNYLLTGHRTFSRRSRQSCTVLLIAERKTAACDLYFVH